MFFGFFFWLKVGVSVPEGNISIRLGIGRLLDFPVSDGDPK